ncbi:uncharacterized protein LOC110980536 [Acanthaster planci]|uniref:Uncharacterized protein LOC110980536 n=1 Tax=Acanthaster planci TaxID=133434 RepID=A0A8B7YKR6_ACAPL|nr:uncharacterized protein LOC110980536 [Acanthaster planci]
MDDKKWRSGWILLLVLVQISVKFVQCRPVASKEDDSLASAGLLTKDSRLAHNLVLGLLVTIATLISLTIVLVLCTCASKPDSGRDDETKGDTEKEEIQLTNNGVPESPSPEALTAPDSETALTVSANNARKMRSASVQSASSSPGHSDDPLTRCSTCERRLPELPPTPMPPVTPTNEDEEDDCNRMYDVIGETKNSPASPTNEDGKKENTDDEVEDDQYASVTNNAALNQARGPQTELAEDTDYNSIGSGNVRKTDVEEGDDPYTSVVVGGDTKEVETKDDKEGYSRLRSIQKRPGRDDSSEAREKDGYARLRDITLGSATVDGAVGGAVGGAIGGAVGMVKDDDEEVPPVPYKPPDLQNEEDEEPNSTIPRTPSVGTAGASAAVGAVANSDGNAAAPAKKREPPYTQVSARESLEVVRARQQAEQNARIAAHYQTIEEDQSLDADHDGIYEPVDDQQLDGQLVMSPPPLPSDRQGSSNGPIHAASNSWQVPRAPRVYEEITDETRPRPPNVLAGAANPQGASNEDIEPYAVTEKRANPAEAPMYTVVDKKSKANYAKVNKANKSPQDQANNNARTEARASDPGSPPPTNEEGDLPLYAVVDKKSKGQGSKSPGNEDTAQFTWDMALSKQAEVEDNYQAMDEEDNYQSVGDATGSSSAGAAAIAGGMVHVSGHEASKDLWTKKEHMYIDVETTQPSKLAETNHKAGESQRGNHSYESVEVVPPSKTVSKKEKQKQAKKAKKEAKKERKMSKSSKHTKDKEKDKGGAAAGPSGEDTVWQRQDSQEANGNGNNNINQFDDYENVSFPLQETRL